ncbi:hypothetical protein M9194_13200 [Vibrio sp. S4M6]|uniref:hypothetical protein n=1 Tax=Vibrio sinus TaxID=2946865 RepID=UPI002029C713|nr:hypothetical protein [Vibrio sinus]MCL9782384.1 hypothetical protein [Vibrio sinus]
MKIAILSPKNSKSEDNDITVISSQPMYQSTGKSKNEVKLRGIWFPFICTAGVDYNPRIIKPFDDQDLQDKPNFLEKYFTLDILKITENKYILQKFGNMYCMGISIAIDRALGKNIWDKYEILKNIKALFASKYNNLIPRLIHNPSEINKVLGSSTITNEWLIENGSRYHYTGGNIYESGIRRQFPNFRTSHRNEKKKNIKNTISKSLFYEEMHIVSRNLEQRCCDICSFFLSIDNYISNRGEVIEDSRRHKPNTTQNNVESMRKLFNVCAEEILGKEHETLNRWEFKKSISIGTIQYLKKEIKVTLAKLSYRGKSYKLLSDFNQYFSRNYKNTSMCSEVFITLKNSVNYSIRIRKNALGAKRLS